MPVWIALAGLLLALAGQCLLGQLADMRGWLLYAIGLSGVLLGLATARDNTTDPCRTARWPPGRLSLLTLLVSGQAVAIALAQFDHLLWPVALPWLLSLAAAVAACLPATARCWRLRPSPRVLRMLLVAGLTLLAGWLRLPNLETLPSGIHGDEGEFGAWALAVMQGQGPAPFGVAFLGDPALYVHLLAPLVAALGPTMAAIRLPSALVGTATIPVLYGLVRELFGDRPALLSAFLLATSAVHIHFSRLALNVIEVPFFACLSLWCLARGSARQRDVWYLLAGISGGLGCYFHFGARLLAPILLLVLLGHLTSVRAGWRAWLRAPGLTGGGALLALAPLLAHLSRSPHQLTEHMRERAIWNHWEELAGEYRTIPSDTLGILWGQLRRTIGAFTLLPDPSGGAEFYTFAGAPLLNGILAPCALLGLAALCLQVRDLRARLILIWFAVPVVFGSILTDMAGQAHRLIHPLVPVLLAAALLIDRLSRLVSRWLPDQIAAVIVPLLLLLPPLAGLWDGQLYFRPGVTGQLAPAHTAQARCLESLPPGTLAFVAGAPWIYADHGASRYLGHAVERRDLRDPLTELPADPGGRPLAIIVHASHREWLPRIRAAYPAARLVEIQRPAGRAVLTILELPAAGQPAGAWSSLCGRGNDTRVLP